jgi:hypothetical protein
MMQAETTAEIFFALCLFSCSRLPFNMNSRDSKRDVNGFLSSLLHEMSEQEREEEEEEGGGRDFTRIQNLFLCFSFDS